MACSLHHPGSAGIISFISFWHSPRNSFGLHSKQGPGLSSKAASLPFEDEVHMDVAVSSPQAVQHTRLIKRGYNWSMLEMKWLLGTDLQLGLRPFLANHSDVMLEKQTAPHQHDCSRLGIGWWIQCLCNPYFKAEHGDTYGKELAALPTWLCLK